MMTWYRTRHHGSLLPCNGLNPRAHSLDSNKWLQDHDSWRIQDSLQAFLSAHPAVYSKSYPTIHFASLHDNFSNTGNVKKHTKPPCFMWPPKSNSIESDMAVESRRKTEFTFTFSLKTNQGNGILASFPLTELCKQQRATRWNFVKLPTKLEVMLRGMQILTE